MKKRIFSVLLCVMIFVSMSFSVVSASENANTANEVVSNSAIQPRLTYIIHADATCSITGGSVECAVSVFCSSTASSCKAVAKLYRRPVGSSGSWTLVATFTDTGVDDALAYGSRTATSGYEYRVYASVTAYASNGASETSTFYSKVAK